MAPRNPFSTDWTKPGQSYVSVTPSDTTEYDPPLRGFIVGAAGDVAVEGPDDDEVAVVLPAMVAGVVHPCAAKKINATGTTATGIVGIR